MNIGIKTVAMIGLATLLGWSAATMAKADVPLMTTEYIVVKECSGATTESIKTDAESKGFTQWKSLKSEDLEKFKAALVQEQQIASIQAVTHVGQMDFYTFKDIENLFVVTADAEGCVLNTFIVPRDLTDKLMEIAFGEDA